MIYALRPCKKGKLSKKVPSIIKKLKAASEALYLFQELLPVGADGPSFDQRGELAEKLAQYAEFLEQAEWWKAEV